MASATTCRLLTLLFSIGALLSIPAAARPCKGLFITSYSFTLIRQPHFNPNPNSDSEFVTIFTTTSTLSQSNPRPSLYLADRRYFPSGELERPKPKQQLEQPRSSSGLGLFDVGSLRNRAKDILKVAIPLLCVVASGTFVALTMYFAWSVYVEDSDSDGDHAAIESPKKMGYVTIPIADSIPNPTKV